MPGPDSDRNQNAGQPAPRRRVSYAIGNRHSTVTFRWILLPSLAVVLVGLVGVFAGPRLFKEVRSIRAARLADSSRQAWDRGDWETAWRGLQAALKLDRSQLDAARLGAELLGRFGSPASLDHWRVVTRDPSATWEDHLAFFDTAIRISRTDVAADVLKDLVARRPGDDAVTERQIGLALRLGRHAEATALSRAALDRDPLNPRWELALGEALLRSAEPRPFAEGRRILMSIALGNGPLHVAAVEQLALRGRLGVAESQALVRALDGIDPTDAVVLRLKTHLRLAGTDVADQREPILSDLVAAAAALEPAARVMLGEYALEAGAPAAALELVPGQIARTFAPAVSVHLLALAAKPDAAEPIRALINEVGTPLSGALRGAAGAVLAARQGDRVRSADLFARAVADGLRSNEPVTDLTTIGRLAEVVEDPGSAIEAYDALLNFPEAIPAAAASLGRLLPVNGDYPRRFRLLSRLHDFMPGSREVSSEYAYLALVLGQEIPRAADLFRRFNDEEPANRTARAGRALALAISGDGEAALGLAEGTGLPFESLGQRERFIHVLCLAVANQRGAALNLMGRIPFESLQAEEVALLNRHLDGE